MTRYTHFLLAGVLLGALAFGMAACNGMSALSPVASGTPQELAALSPQNPCGRGSWRADTIPPSPTAQVDPAGVPQDYIDTAPPSVAAWKDAIVSIHFTALPDRFHTVQGLVVDPEGKIATVLNPELDVSFIKVDVPHVGSFPGQIVATDPTTSAVLISIPARGLVAAPLSTATLDGRERVVVVTRTLYGNLSSSTTLAEPASNAPELLVALQRQEPFYGKPGLVFVSEAGDPLGLTMPATVWDGTAFTCRGCGLITFTPAVRLSALTKMLGAGKQEGPAVPEGISYHGGPWRAFKDSPSLRRDVALPAQQAMHSLGEPLAIENLGLEAFKIIGGQTRIGQEATVLEILYREPQALTDRKGQVLGYGRYIVFLQGAAGGANEAVLCGMDSMHLGAAFTSVGGLGDLHQLVRDAPNVNVAYVESTPFPR